MLQTIIPFLIAYLVICLATAHFLTVESTFAINPRRCFWVCLLCSPLLAVLMYGRRL